MSSQQTAVCDAAVVGGGIVGLSAALNLAERGLKVCVFERSVVASEQSSRAWGFIRQQGRHEAELPLAAEANGLWVELTRKFGFQATSFTPGGILVPAETDADEARIVSAFDVAKKFQLSTRILDPTQMRDLVPELAGSWRSGLFTPGDAHADPQLSTLTIARAAREAGVAIFENEPVLTIECAAGATVRLGTMRRRHCRASVLVLAGGVGTPALARSIGIDLPIQVVRSSVAQTVRVERFTEVAMWAPKASYRPHADGSLVIGNGYRGVGADYDLTIHSLRHLRYFLAAYRRNWRLLRLRLGGEFVNQLRAALTTHGAAMPLPEPKANLRKIQHNRAAIRSMFPHLGDIGLERVWAGRIDLTPDIVPIVDQPRPELSVFVAAGFSGHGFALAPSIGRQLAQWIVDGGPSLDLRPFRLGRFSEGQASADKQAL